MKNETRGNALLVVAICLTTTTTIFLAARLWARFVILRKAGADDYTIIPAYVISVLATILTLIKCYRYGYNGHVWDVEFEHLAVGTIYNYWEIVLYMVARALINISFLLLYLRVLSRSNEKVFRYTVIGSIFFVIFYTTASVLAWIFQCWPVEAAWLQYRYPEPYDKPFSCFSTTTLQQFMVVITVLTHVWITILPLYVIRRVKANTRQKEVLWMLVGFGLVVVGASVAWLYHQLRILLGNHIDSIWENYPSFIWNLVALNVAIMCACGPALNVFFVNRFAPHGIVARFNKRKKGKKGVPRNKLNTTRRFEEDMLRTINNTMFTHEAFCTWVSRITGSGSGPSVPERAVLKKVTVAVESESAMTQNMMEKTMVSATFSIGTQHPLAPAPSRSSLSTLSSVCPVPDVMRNSHDSLSPKSSLMYEKKESPGV